MSDLDLVAGALLALREATAADTIVASDGEGNSIQASVSDEESVVDGLERLELAGFDVVGIARRGTLGPDAVNAPTPSDFAPVVYDAERGVVLVAPAPEWLQEG